MFSIKFQIEDSKNLREWLKESDFDPALHLNGFIEIYYKGIDFFENYLKAPIDGRVPYEMHIKYLIFNLIKDLMHFIEDPNKTSIYELGKMPNLIKFVLLTKNSQTQLFMHAKTHGESIKEHWYDGENILYQIKIPLNSNFVIEKEVLINGIIESIKDFFSIVDHKFPELNNYEEITMLKRDFDQLLVQYKKSL